ncbi:MAG: pirin family protein [Deltaproteobacteria bacterium]|nr:pirin family protein [Deltaproteobacteria bacterium]MCW5806942.1 pirin family protein [Deltaproteobacteria bacterium]
MPDPVDPVLGTFKLGFPWETADPFLFCVHHDDAYPAGNEHLGPAASLGGRELGSDFAGLDGWRMYHGEQVPGFPGHPHRGFETVTIVRRGLIDHADSLGAAARYGRGDVQWLTAGKGIVHSEMFPLVHRDAPNPLELFQIWLNLPRADKLVEPNFTMLWERDIPHVTGGGADVTVIAGAIADRAPLAPPPHSWAARADADVAIWTIRLDAGGAWTMPPARPGTNRTLYVFRGDLRLGDRAIRQGTGVRLRPGAAIDLAAPDAPAEALVLQGRPIGEPVVAHGPFVMNTRAEIQQAFVDYQRTRFGGWPWPTEAPTHGRDEGRFARFLDGRIERAS